MDDPYEEKKRSNRVNARHFSASASHGYQGFRWFQGSAWEPTAWQALPGMLCLQREGAPEEEADLSFAE